MIKIEFCRQVIPSMKFCKYCKSRMIKHADGQTGLIVYKCVCLYEEPGVPEDTLMDEEIFLESGSLAIHQDLITNAPFDPAAFHVPKKCPSCGLDYLTLVRIGEQEVVMYTCDCGYRATHDGYEAATKSN